MGWSAEFQERHPELVTAAQLERRGAGRMNEVHPLSASPAAVRFAEFGEEVRRELVHALGTAVTVERAHLLSWRLRSLAGLIDRVIGYAHPEYEPGAPGSGGGERPLSPSPSTAGGEGPGRPAAAVPVVERTTDEDPFL